MLARRIVAVLLLVLGGVWILQGVDLLGGSFMSGQPIWAVFGTILVVFAVALLRGSRSQE